MKILFTADIHIKLGQKNVPVEWSKNRFSMFLDQLSKMQDQADIVIIGGDVFDRLPNMDEVELYFELVSSIKKPCWIYSGNHEMVRKDTTFLSYLKRATNRINPKVEVIDEIQTIYFEEEGTPAIDIVPYNRLRDIEKTSHKFSKNILCTHVRAEIPPHVKPEIDLELLTPWKVVLAGDLHSYENSQRNILYPGSPYTISFHRNEVRTGAVLFDSTTLEHSWLEFELPQLIKRTVGVNDPKPQTAFNHTVYEIEGDLHELGLLEDSDLIDKKVVRRSQEAQLLLDPELTLAEEVREYLIYILQLPESVVADTLEEFYNYADKIEI